MSSSRRSPAATQTPSRPDRIAADGADDVDVTRNTTQEEGHHLAVAVARMTGDSAAVNGSAG